jgi:hypothetical protein
VRRVARHLRLPALLAALAALAAAPAAQAATMAPLRPCYVAVSPTRRETMNITATGFTPFSVVDLTIDGATEPVDANGFGGVIEQRAAPYVKRGQRPFSVALAQEGTPANATGASSLVTALAVHVRPRQADTGAHVRFSGRGFTASRPIWGHYVLRGHVHRTVRLAAAPTGACGTFSVRHRQFPMTSPRPGHWVLQIDQQKRYSPTPASNFVPIGFTVRRIVS